ncbi:S8 family serine peptidase [candidate division WOR-3 bacterium]|nr:S8 family serine peptidase [candidate division WOR-3 bacterium]
MKGRYLHAFKDASRVAVMWISLVLATVAWGSIESGRDSLTEEGFIVKVSNPEGLEEFASRLGVNVNPLITYPNPSQEVLRVFGNYYVVSTTDKQQSERDRMLDLLKNLPYVEHLEPNTTVRVEPELESAGPDWTLHELDLFPYTPNDPFFPYQWDKVITETNWAWSLSTGSPDVTIALLDSGVDPDHPDLEANLVAGYNFLDNNANSADDNGHGTKIAGSAAAKIDNATGIAGVAGNTSIMPLKVVNSMGSMARSEEINAILYAADNGAQVINISARFSGPSTAEKASVEYAWNKGLFLCASAGNDGCYDPNHYPSAYEHVMSAGASTQEDTRASFSNYGSNVDVYAPGKSVWLTLMDGGYGTGTGTSYASPQIAGLAALIWSAYPEYTNREVWDAIILGADTIDSDEGKILRMNARKALGREHEEPGYVAEAQDDFFRASASGLQVGVMRFTYEVSQPTDYILRIFDVAGRTVYVQEGETVTQGQIECDPQLPPSVYFWLFKTEFGVDSGKIIFVE